MAALTPNLSLYKPAASIGGLSIPTASTPKNQYVASLTPSNPLATLNLSNVGGVPAPTGVTNQSVLPSYLQNGGNSNGATAPVATSIKPSSSTASTGSAGSYKGVAITPGNDASVAAQIAAIDAGNGGGSSSLSTPAGQQYLASLNTGGAGTSTGTTDRS